MRVYFLSETPAALKLNGLYIGVIDSFERFADIGDEDVLVEIIPDGNLQQINFFINANFWQCPPDFADVYLMGVERLIFVRRYNSKDNEVNIVSSTTFCGNRVTLIRHGGARIVCEGKGLQTYSLPNSFLSAAFKEDTIGGLPVLILHGDGCIAVISDSCKLVFINSADIYFCDDKLNITLSFGTCARIKGQCSFAYDGKSMMLADSKAVETSEVTEDAMPFAFFECMLTRADCGKYLSRELSGKIEELSAFLGDFIDVATPPSSICAAHPDAVPVGLVYAVQSNLFCVRFFSTVIERGKIVNIIELQ